MPTGPQKSLVFGALVQWDHEKAYGIIASNNGRIIHVHWDDAGHPPQFSASDPPLSRVDFMGRSVQRKSTGENVAVLSPVAAATPHLAMSNFFRHRNGEHCQRTRSGLASTSHASFSGRQTGLPFSTLARRLGAMLGFRVVELDAIRHAGGWDSET